MSSGSDLQFQFQSCQLSKIPDYASMSNAELFEWNCITPPDNKGHAIVSQ